jgi:hypothetical protein
MTLLNQLFEALCNSLDIVMNYSFSFDLSPDITAMTTMRVPANLAQCVIHSLVSAFVGRGLSRHH